MPLLPGSLPVQLQNLIDEAGYGRQLETRACRLLPQLRNSAKRLRHLEDENRRLKIAVADLTLDREVLKAVISKRVELVSRREDVAFALAKFPVKPAQGLRADADRSNQLPL